jgi:uncharacterized protein YggE
MSTSDTRTILIHTKGYAYARADTAFVDLYVRADGMLLADALAEARQKTEKIVEAVQKSGEVISVTVTDIQVGSARPLGFNNSPKPEVLRNILVTIPPSPEMAVKIFDTGVRLGASLQAPMFGETATGVLFGLMKADPTEEAATKNAIEEAKRRAELTASLMGKRIGAISKVTHTPPFGVPEGIGPGRRPSSRFPTRFVSPSPDRVKVSISLTIEFELVG